MTLDELERQCPQLLECTKTMPADIRTRCRVRTHPAGSIIHQKDDVIDYFGIVARGENRVVNELMNGNVYALESNKPPAFIGEVTILAGCERASVTIEATTEVTAVYISRRDAERWLAEDLHILTIVSRQVAHKLYMRSYSSGTRLFYPPSYQLMEYLVGRGRAAGLDEPSYAGILVIPKTRQALQEELGINVKTLNRTIAALRDEGLIGVERGKIVLTREQYRRAIPWLEKARLG